MGNAVNSWAAHHKVEVGKAAEVRAMPLRQVRILKTNLTAAASSDMRASRLRQGTHGGAVRGRLKDFLFSLLFSAS